MVQKEYYPSQKRYYANNPTVSFRLPKVLKKKLEKLDERGDMTMGQYVRDFLEGIIEEREKEDKIYIRGLEDGYRKGREAWQIYFKCSVCFENIYIKPMSEAHKEIIVHFGMERWGHEACIEERKKKQSSHSEDL